MSKILSSFAIVTVMAMVAGCVSYAPSGVMAEKQPSVQRAAAVINQVADPNLMSQTYRNCRLGDAVVRAEVVNNETTVVAKASNECDGLTYRKEGVQRPAGLEGASPR